MNRATAGARILARLLGCLLVVGCTTAARSESDDYLLVDSDPPAASIFVNGTFAGTTPKRVRMPSDRSISVVCKLPGRQTSTTTVYREGAPATAFDNPAFALVEHRHGCRLSAPATHAVRRVAAPAQRALSERCRARDGYVGAHCAVMAPQLHTPPEALVLLTVQTGVPGAMQASGQMVPDVQPIRLHCTRRASTMVLSVTGFVQPAQARPP